ncbi:MAG: tRNA uridine-5-carboxymethylaminomethyl(34) synthesis GTPase MnmE [Candidatus Gastranaerophilales bacterium]|nr:tRNA uridine-5-carboxymethylaminomethyl(34) synthesis GTPase MnmE [Candidatus Gastranaerophilales bacterium]
MAIKYEMDTISAIATPLGVGGVGIIRVSGTKAFDIIQKIFSNKKIKTGKIAHGWIIDGGDFVDEVVVLPFQKPNSYTGEDVIEIQCHGGINVVRKILDLTIKNGARLAERGEYTKRAFLNKKLDLSQAEAVLDLIHAKTTTFAMKSAKNLSGKLSQEVNKIKDILFNLYSLIIAAVDFPEDVKEPDYNVLEEKIKSAIDSIDYILKFSKSSNILRQGIKIAVVGRPNVGKSSLFNTLLNLDRAIVTEIAGTTRDIIQETIDLDGISATIIDTAGIRDAENIDKVESIGIDYTKKCIAEADIVLFLFDIVKGITTEDEEIFNLIQDKPFIKIASKFDLHKKSTDNVLSVSVKTGENIENLKKEIKKIVIENNDLEGEFITNQRQQECLERSKEALIQALKATQLMEIQDLISIDIKTALMHVSEVSGEVITDEVLDNIFENFCIGK